MKRSPQSVNVAGTAHGGAGKNLDEIRPRFPGQHDFGRRKRSRKNRYVLPDREFHHLRIKPCAGDEVSTRLQAAARGFEVQHRPGAHDHFAVVPRQAGDHLQSPWYGHGDFDDRYAAASDRLSRKDRILGRMRPDSRDDPDFFNPPANLVTAHDIPSEGSWYYRDYVSLESTAVYRRRGGVRRARFASVGGYGNR